MEPSRRRQRPRFLDRGFRTALDSIPDMVVILDSSRRVVFANRASTGEDSAPRTARRLEGMLCSEALHGSDDDAGCNSVNCMLEKVLASGRTMSAVHRHRRPDGSDFDAEVTMAPVQLSPGESHYLVVSRDISGQTRERDRLRQAGREFRLFVESALEGVLAVDEKFLVSYVNPSLAAMLGTSPRKLVGIPWLSLIHPEWRERQEAHFEARRQGLSERYETCMLGHDGQTVEVLISATPIFDSRGRFKGAFASVVDLTYRSRQEREQKDRLARLDLHQKTILDLARSLVSASGNPLPGLERIAEEGRRAIGAAGARIWMSSGQDDCTALSPVVCAGASCMIASPPVLSPEAFPRFFRALSGSRVIDVSDALCDERTCELLTSYLEPCGISSLIAAPVIIEGRTVGFLVLEHTGSPRNWFDDESAFAGELADQAAHLLIVSERRKAESALRESEERYRTISESISDFAFSMSLGEDGVLAREWVTDSYNRVTGYSPEERDAMGGLLSVVHPGDLRRVSEQVSAMLEKGSSENFEFRVLSKSGDTLWFRVTARPVRDPSSGRIVRVLGAGKDVTLEVAGAEERRKLEQRMLQAQKLESLAVLAGGIAHDFNNLLVAILGNADIALDELSDLSPARPLVEEIVRASRRAADLCNQMLAYSGRGRLQMKRLDLSDLVTEMAHILEVSISRKTAIRYRCAKHLPPVLADPVQIQQVVMNLIINASDAIGDSQGQISISTGCVMCDVEYLRSVHLDDDLAEGEYVFVEVSDTGCGMDEETKNRIFDPFFTTKFTGRGLGLAAVLGIVRGHKGAVKVYSEPGRGSTFKVLLPSARGVPSAAPSLPPADRRGGSGTVLLVDDDQAVLSVGRAMLERLGYEVLTASDGTGALEALRGPAGAALKAAILDMTMPGMDGDEVFQQIRSIRADLPVIVSSGYDEQEMSARFSGRDVAAFLQKPYRMQALSECLGSIG